MTDKPIVSGTETGDPRYGDIDLWPVEAALDALAEAQMTATALVRAAVPQMTRIVEAAVPRLRENGRLFYVGAGTSGRIGMQDGVELTPTFGFAPERLVMLLAGGTDAVRVAVEGAEDRADVARDEILAHAPGPNDVVFGIAASGNTPYTVGAVIAARGAGALTIGLACNADGALLRAAEFALSIPTGPEVIAGSTRLKAGTAQKAALNLMSTAIMIRLGHAYRGRMVDMKLSNAKLQDRAIGMVRALAGGTDAQITAALAASGNNVKRAVLLRHGLSIAEAEAALTASGGDLRPVLAGIASEA